jgi:diguanylate cyclase (GGDEF)-like protein
MLSYSFGSFGAVLSAAYQPYAKDYQPYADVLSNGFMRLLYIGLLAYFILTVIKIAAQWKEIRLPKYFFFIVLSMFAWNAVSVLRFFVDDEPSIYILSFLPLVFGLLFIFSVCFFALRFYNHGIFIRPGLLTASLVFPAMTLFNIFHGHNELFGRGGYNIIRTDPIVVTENLFYVHGRFGPWFYVTVGLGLLFVVLMPFFTIFQHIKLPKIYHAPSEKLVTGTLVISIGFIINFINSLNGRETLPVDIALIFAVLSLRFFYSATLGTQGLIFLSQARDDVIQHLDQCVFFLNEEGTIIFRNDNAVQRFEELQFSGNSYPALLKRLIESSVDYEELPDEEGGTDYHFEAGGKKSTFNLREKPILDKKGRQIGMYAVYSDVTENRELIRRLEVGAGRDVLTGLNNRAMMESLKSELDTLDNLPLAVIMADLNDLKVTNDQHGHQAGDIMLRVCGEALSEKCPPTAQVGRIGGDEFLILLPKTDITEAERVTSAINAHLEKIKDYPYNIRVAMGCGVKNTADEDLSAAMQDADSTMYAMKRQMKGGAEIRNAQTKLI